MSEWLCRSIWLSLLLFSLAACRPRNQVTVQEYPLIPVDRVEMGEGVAGIRGPFYTHDRQHPLVGYTAGGEVAYQIHDAALFPTDVWVVFTPDMAQPRVFLARSPHGGCLVRWEWENNRFSDPCYGSRFAVDGAYLSGPAPRNLDELPAELRGTMIWVRNEIIYGKPIEEPGRS